MAEKKRTYPALDKWAHRRIVTVEIDADMKVDFRLPDLGVWIAQGRIPNPLRPIAEKIEFGIVEPEKLSDEERQTYYDLQAFIVATHLVKPNLVEELGSEEAAKEWVMEEMPPTHRDLIWLRAFHLIPDEVMASIGDVTRFRDEPASGLSVVGSEANGAGT